MRSLEKPNPAHVYDAASEIAALRSYRDTEEDRAIPTPAPDHLVLATWNVANLGLHKRRSEDDDVIAEIVSWFALIAIQEVADDLEGLNQVVASSPPTAFRCVVQ